MEWRAGIAAVCGFSLACAGLFGRTLDHAEQHLSEGRPARALSITAGSLGRSSAPLEPRLLALHLEALRGLGREEEALAFEDYASRLSAGVDFRAEELNESRSECTGPQDGAELVRDFGKRSPRRTLGAVAARFEIHRNGDIGRIRVMRARDPAAAWWMIDSISRARLWTTRLERRAKSRSNGFPVRLCTWWEVRFGGSQEIDVPERGCIRGFCTHMPGAPPFM